MIRASDNVVMTRKQRGYKLMDQKANSIADMAEVLGRLWERDGSREIGLERVAADVRVDVRWSNIADAEFAETWRGNVVHDRLEVTTNHRRVPPKYGREGEDWIVDEEVLDGVEGDGKVGDGEGNVKAKQELKQVEGAEPKKKSAWSKLGSWIPIPLPLRGSSR